MSAVSGSVGTHTITPVCAGMARVFLRVVRFDPLDDRLEVYPDIADTILQFVSSVFSGISQDGTTAMPTRFYICRPDFVSDSLKYELDDEVAAFQVPGAAVQVPLQCEEARSKLLAIEEKVGGSEADRVALLLTVGILLLHILIEKDSSDQVLNPLLSDSSPVLDEEMDREFPDGPDTLDHLMDALLSTGVGELFDDKPYHSFAEFEAEAARRGMPHLEALKQGVLHMRTKGNKCPPEKKGVALMKLRTLLEESYLDISSQDFDWLTPAV